MSMRTHLGGELRASHIGESVTLCGWVHRRRDHGGVIFVDCRDHIGLAQVVFNPEHDAMFADAESLRAEYVIQVQGTVQARPEGTVNADLPTGEIEVVAESLTILNKAKALPFPIDGYQPVGEEVRLQYRFLDLRRPQMLKRLQQRAKAISVMRNVLEAEGFTEVETPVLTKATPEGARDYLVPSRTHPGQFFALPQSPQIFKQLLMAAGMDRYYQVVKCFRDEDLRADRQPEFTQLDMELSFTDEETIIGLIETLLCAVFKQTIDVDLPESFPRMSYADAMEKYGVDRPDLRIPLQLQTIDELCVSEEFAVFAGPAADGASRVAVMRVPGGGELTRKQIDDYTTFVGKHGAKGLAYIKVTDVKAGREGLQSPIVKFLSDDMLSKLLSTVAAEDGDMLFFGAGKTDVVNASLGALRVQLGLDLNLLTAEWCPLWVVDFPMFEVDSSGKGRRLKAIHHPFTRPAVASSDELQAQAENCLSHAYDVVLNGFELGGGSLRIHDMAMQQAVFDMLGISEQEAEKKFGHLLQALRLGCPPHGGIALGLDRLLMLMTGAASIRGVMAFPKTQTASCPLTKAPSEANEEQLKELHLRLRSSARVEPAQEG